MGVPTALLALKYVFKFIIALFFLSYYPLSFTLYGGGLTVITVSSFLSSPYYIHNSYSVVG